MTPEQELKQAADTFANIHGQPPRISKERFKVNDDLAGHLYNFATSQSARNYWGGILWSEQKQEFDAEISRLTKELEQLHANSPQPSDDEIEEMADKCADQYRDYGNIKFGFIKGFKQALSHAPCPATSDAVEAQKYTKDEVIDAITPFMEQDFRGYAEQVYTMLEAHFKLFKSQPSKTNENG